MASPTVVTVNLVAYGYYAPDRGAIVAYQPGEEISRDEPLYVQLASPSGIVWPWEGLIGPWDRQP